MRYAAMVLFGLLGCASNTASDPPLDQEPLPPDGVVEARRNETVVRAGKGYGERLAFHTDGDLVTISMGATTATFTIDGSGKSALVSSTLDEPAAWSLAASAKNAIVPQKASSSSHTASLGDDPSGGSSP